MTHTKDILAAELRKAGLDSMATKAAAGLYHDYLSVLPDPALALDRDLVEAINGGNVMARELRARHHSGDFDATTAESDDWARSPEGQEAFDALKRGRG